MAPSLLYRGLQNASSGATISGSVTNGLLQAGNQSQKTCTRSNILSFANAGSVSSKSTVKKTFPYNSSANIIVVRAESTPAACDNPPCLYAAI